MPISEFELLAMGFHSDRSISFSRCVILLITLTLGRSLGANDFCALIFDLKTFRALESDSSYSRDSREVSSSSRCVRFYRS